MEVTRRRGRRRWKLLDDLKDRRGYTNFKEEALDRTMWRNRFGGGSEPVVRQNTEWINFTQDDSKALKKVVVLTWIAYCNTVKISLTCTGVVIWFCRS